MDVDETSKRVDDDGDDDVDDGGVIYLEYASNTFKYRDSMSR